MSWLVKRHTLDNARAVGLNDRGVIAPGYKADLNVIDFDKLARRGAGDEVGPAGRRQAPAAEGAAATAPPSSRAAVTYRDGEATGALPGKLVRGPQQAA